MIESQPAAPAPVPNQGRCLEHPDRLAEWTCERCGRFACGGCVRAGAGGRCAACVNQMMAAVPSSAGVARWAVRLLYASAALSVLSMLLLAGEARTLLYAVGVVEAMQFIATSILFLRWLHRAVRLVQVLAENVSATPGWAVGYWFVPIINLYRPYQIVGRLAAAAGANLPSGLLGWWWALWIVTSLMNRTGGTSAPLAMTMMSSLASAGAAILCAGVVSGIQRALVARRQSFAPAVPSP